MAVPVEWVLRTTFAAYQTAAAEAEELGRD